MDELFGKPVHLKLPLLYLQLETELVVPFLGGVNAGFPSPANDFIEQGIDLNKELIKHPSSTFYAYANGHSMTKAGIHDGDLLIIDKSLPYKNDAIVVCYLDGEFTLKRLQLMNGKCYLKPENDSFQSIEVTKDNDFLIWGVVTYSIKPFHVRFNRL